MVAQSARKNPGKSPEQLREERAIVQYWDYRFQLANIKLTAPDGARSQVGICYVIKGGEHYTVRVEDCRPVHCTCKDTAYNGGIACKHRRMVELFVNGTPPEPVESLVAALPVPPFDVDAEAGRLASLEAQEARHAQALRDRQLWD